ncbi:MAG: cysteine hydrolase [Saccharofermentans sp.]|nr:cysteine hydrolase [Saccharofermentans sp.]
MRKVLVVVDCQKDFIDGALGFEGADAILPGIIERIREYKDNGDEVIYTLDTHTPDYMNTQEGKNLPVPHCIKGSEGYELDESLKSILSDCRAFEKPTFGSLDLANYLASCASDIKSIELCGLVSNICVISNSIIAKAAAPEAEIIVDSKLTASFDPKRNEETLDILKGVQVTVL